MTIIPVQLSGPDCRILADMSDPAFFFTPPGLDVMFGIFFSRPLYFFLNSLRKNEICYIFYFCARLGQVSKHSFSNDRPKRAVLPVLRSLPHSVGIYCLFCGGRRSVGGVLLLGSIIKYIGARQRNDRGGRNGHHINRRQFLIIVCKVRAMTMVYCYFTRSY